MCDIATLLLNNKNGYLAFIPHLEKKQQGIALTWQELYMGSCVKEFLCAA